MVAGLKLMVATATSNVETIGPRVVVRNAQLDYPMVTDRSSIKAAVSAILGFKSNAVATRTRVHALNNVSLTIHRGERLGIIGHNGAGKSTLLRALAGVYPLTRGSIEVTGRTQGLFDLGTGFEMEATGRENIMYRGLSIGGNPTEIAAREEEIVEFAGLGEFIDMPMRAYSAGMVVRLGFAISTYLEGEVLLIDEVFGAGDANFQAKASQRMSSLMDKAGILVMVSHDLGMMQEFCTRVIWLSGGQVVVDGGSREVVNLYLQNIRAA